MFEESLFALVKMRLSSNGEKDGTTDSRVGLLTVRSGNTVGVASK